MSSLKQKIKSSSVSSVCVFALIEHYLDFWAAHLLPHAWIKWRHISARSTFSSGPPPNLFSTGTTAANQFNTAGAAASLRDPCPSEDTHSWVRTLKNQTFTPQLSVCNHFSPNFSICMNPCVCFCVCMKQSSLTWYQKSLSPDYLFMDQANQWPRDTHCEGGGWCKKRCGWRKAEVATLPITSPHQIIPVSLHSVFSVQEADFSLFPSVAIIGWHFLFSYTVWGAVGSELCVIHNTPRLKVNHHTPRCRTLQLQ